MTTTQHRAQGLLSILDSDTSDEIVAIIRAGINLADLYGSAHQHMAIPADVRESMQTLTAEFDRALNAIRGAA